MEKEYDTYQCNCCPKRFNRPKGLKCIPKCPSCGTFDVTKIKFDLGIE